MIDRETATARRDVAEWIATERHDYADVKYDPSGENMHRLRVEMRNYGIDDGSEWWVFLTNYLRRAQIQGLDGLAGRQAFGKFIVTCMNTLEAAVMEHGPMPRPGVESGEIEDWT